MLEPTFTFEAIGTTWKITIFNPISESKKKELLNVIDKRIEQFDKDYSRFRSDSFVSSLNKKGTYNLPSDAKPLFDLYELLYKKTSGQFTPLVGQTLSDLGYDAQYSFREKETVTSQTWEALDYNFPLLTIKEPVLLDFGAGGKGYLVDIVSDLLTNHRYKEHVVEAGGDLICKGSKQIKVGLEDPENESKAIGSTTLINKSICSSSGNRRTWNTYHHIIDPHTKESPRDILATWVIADSALLADSLATCLFLVDRSLMKDFKCEWCILYNTRDVKYSSHFPADFFFNESN